MAASISPNDEVAAHASLGLALVGSIVAVYAGTAFGRHFKSHVGEFGHS
jgi:hypothetical protein